ncbi:MAG: hypothetical protein ACOCT9_02390 [archaeon]
MIVVEEPTTNEDEVDYSKLTALPETLKEIRFLFELEENRRQNIEHKAEIIIVFNGIMITLATVIGIRQHLFFILYLGITFVALSASLFAIRIRPKINPHEEYIHFYRYAKEDPKKTNDQFLLDNIMALKNLEKVNNSKITFLRVSFIITALAFGLLFGGILRAYI